MAGIGALLLPLLVVVSLLPAEVTCHGRLRDPPGRSSMWRYNWPSPILYDDNSLFCGGFPHQWEDMGGKCGLCGDAYDAPREQEKGGKYYTGIVTRHYRSGSVIKVRVEITANHLGYFEFRLCQLARPAAKATKACFDKHVLRLADGSGTQYKLGTRKGIIAVKLRLPRGVRCKRCVIQWKYHAGNSWGVSANGRGCVGCGAQEEFYGCSDVRISRRGGTLTDPEPVSVTHAPTRPPVPVDAVVGPCPSGKYVASDTFKHISTMTNWCMVHCLNVDRYCPLTHCNCKA